jgi:hypothetical protein
VKHGRVRGLLRKRATRDPGIRDDDVGRPEALGESGRGAREKRGIANVALVRDRAFRGQLRDERVELLAPSREQTDGGPLGGVVAGERGPDAARRARDEDGGCDRPQPFGRSARALAMSASITGIMAACEPTFSVDTMNFPSMMIVGTD